MIRTFVALFILVGTALGQSDATQPAVDEVKLLRAQVAVLQSQVRSQAKEIAELKKRLDSSGNSEPAAMSTSRPESSESTYLGRPISKGQLHSFYQEFGRHMFFLDGKLLDTSELIGWQKAGREKGDSVIVNMVLPPVGAARYASGSVDSVVGNVVIVRRDQVPSETGSDGMLRTVGLDGADFAMVGLPVSQYPESKIVRLPNVVFIGVRKIGVRNLQCYAVSPPAPTEEEFGKSLSDGFELRRCRIVKTKDGEKPVFTPVK
jgi:hypothetical protein